MSRRKPETGNRKPEIGIRQREVSVLCVLVGLALCLAGCSNLPQPSLAAPASVEGPAPTQTTAAAPAAASAAGPVKRGLGFWPTDHSSRHLDQAFELLRQNAEIVMVQKDDPFDSPENKATTAVLDNWLDRAGQAGLLKYVALEPFNGDRTAARPPVGWSGSRARVAEPKWSEAYRQKVLEIVERHHPEYLNLGVEANMYYKNNPEDYVAFRALFQRLRQEVKQLQPNAKVFCSYQYEILTGQMAGTKGRAQWELLGEKALEQDVVGISTYPAFLHSTYDPQSVPSDYFQVLREHTHLPIFVAELGWYSSDSVSPASSPEMQAELIQRVPALLQGMNVEAVCWVSMVDLRDLPALAALKSQWPQFFSLGLVDTRLTPKPAWESWKNLKHWQVVEAPERAAAAKRAEKGASASPDAGLHGFLGLGSTVGAGVEPAGADQAPALRWDYKFSSNPLAMIVKPNVAVGASARGLAVQWRSEKDTEVAVVLEESGGARYQSRQPVGTKQSSTVQLPWNQFQLQEDTHDANGRLDPTEVTKLALVDVSGFMGKRGSNRIWLENVGWIVPGGKE
ncbi:MAG: hypothetical protein HY706_06540 [Candidatus Hydrogenedentes bacterium]|nr:hypothetical protein [Candidatus Hydrogenedentota bacterium]